MQIVDKDGNIFGAGLQVNGPDGKPKTSSGGGSPTGPAGGDLSGTYPNPGVVWSNGLPTYNLQYYPLSLNPAGYLTSITSSDIITALGYTPYSNANPSGYITSSALTPYLTSATAASTYYPLTNPSGYITNAALSGYLTAANAASTYYPLTNPNAYISGITGSMVTTALGYTPYDNANPAGYITATALTPYLTSATASSTYQTILVSGTSIKTVNSTSLLGSGDVSVQPTLVSGTNIKTINGASVLGAGDLTVSSAASWGSITGTLSSQSDLQTALNAKQNTLVSGTSINTINGASILSSGNINLPQILYSNHTILSLSGITTEYLKASVPIPTTIGNSMLRITFIAQCLVLGTTGPRSRIRIGTVANPSNAQLTSATTIAQNAVGSAGTVSIFRNMTVTGGASGSILGASFSSNILSDQNMTTTYNTQNVNWTTQQYLYFTIQNNATNTTTQMFSITVELL